MSILLLTCLSTLPQSPAPARAFEVHRLDNGVVFHGRQESAAARQSTFSFLPLGLESDRPGEAQFAHLAEHVMLRSTDPRHPRRADLGMNGETTTSAMRLESLAEPSKWRQTLQRHARWLLARTCAAKALGLEKTAIEGEERGTVPRGFNHKWATAAWSQFVAGETHAAVHGGVADATVKQVEAYLQRRVDLRRVQIFSIGPRPVAEQVEVLRQAFAGAAVLGKAKAAAVAKSEPAAAIEPLAVGHHQRSWDLAARHYLEWYELPRACSKLQGQIIAQVVMSTCYQRPALREIPGFGVAAYVRSGTRGFLLLSCNLPEGTAVEDLRAAFRRGLSAAGPMLRMQIRGGMLSRQLLTVPNFAAQRQQVKNPRFRDLVEAQFAMNIGYACVRSGLTFDQLGAAYAKLNGARLAKLLAAAAAPERRVSVVIDRK